jgi:transcriptional regulator CtsR
VRKAKISVKSRPLKRTGGIKIRLCGIIKTGREAVNGYEEGMAKISDIIEEFIMALFEEDNGVVLSRNDLAVHFGCVPSQINYVLSTRFTLDRGYKIESKRGGGGFIRIVKLGEDGRGYLSELTEAIGNELPQYRAAQIVDRLLSDGLINEGEVGIIAVALSDKAIKAPVFGDMIRANMLREIITHIAARYDDKNE